MTTIGIDPGNTHTAAVVLKHGVIDERVYLDNWEFLSWLIIKRDKLCPFIYCEMIASYGMPVGKEVFDTVVWIGRILQVAPGCQRLTRIKIKNTLCHSSKAKDTNVRQRLIDIYGPPGTKKNPGGTYGISGDMWAALAVATAALQGCELYE